MRVVLIFFPVCNQINMRPMLERWEKREKEQLKKILNIKKKKREKEVH
jgi:hypothetical protein